MLRLQLTETEAATLRDVLSEYTSDLGMEIAGTDLKDFRDRLKRKRAVLHAIADRLAVVDPVEV
jgi:hypothetical protein